MISPRQALKFTKHGPTVDPRPFYGRVHVTDGQTLGTLESLYYRSSSVAPGWMIEYRSFDGSELYKRAMGSCKFLERDYDES